MKTLNLIKEYAIPVVVSIILLTAAIIAIHEIANGHFHSVAAFQ